MTFLRKNNGFLLAFLSVLCFSLMNVAVKYTAGRLTTYQVVFARSLLMTLFLLPTIIKIRPILGKRRALLFLRGFLGFIALVANFYSVHHMPLAEATIIFQAVPLAVLPMAFFILKERYTFKQWGYFLLGMAGVVVVLYQDISSSLNYLPALVALLGAILSALAYTLVRILAKSEKNQLIIFYFAAIGLICSAPPALSSWPPLNGELLLLLLAVGVSATLAQLFMTAAYKAEKAAKVAAVNYLAIPLAATWGLLLWGEKPATNTLIGTLMILGALIMMQLGKRN